MRAETLSGKRYQEAGAPLSCTVSHRRPATCVSLFPEELWALSSLLGESNMVEVSWGYSGERISYLLS